MPWHAAGPHAQDLAVLPKSSTLKRGSGKVPRISPRFPQISPEYVPTLKKRDHQPCDDTLI